MDAEDSEIYDYDRSSFFRLLQSAKCRLKYEFIQQQQGLVVCPLKLKLNPRLIKQSENLIDTHLFVPSPFYKNHYIPLNSLIALSSLSQSNIHNGSLPLDHSQQISLILSNIDNSLDKSNNNNELILMSNRRRICKNVKLLNIQTAYSDNCKTYKILIVNKELCFKLANSQCNQYQNRKVSTQINSENDDLDEIVEESDSENQALDEQINSTFESYHNRNEEDRLGVLEAQFTSSFDSTHRGGVVESIPAISHRNSTFMQEASFDSLDDVKKFGQSVDFMHSSGFRDTYEELDDDRYLDENSNLLKADRKLSIQQLKKRRGNPSLIGEDLLNEIELFKKTYIILFTYMKDCELQLEKIYTKYVRKFLSSAKKTMNLDPNSTVYSNIDLMISIACENTIVGCLFSKLWPCLLQLNSDEDSKIQFKCDRVRKLLKLNQIFNLNNETIELCSRFFRIESKYFLINTKSVLREFKRLSLLNNPFEKVECIKNTVELVTNELTILSSKKKSSKNKQTSDGKSDDSIIITSDILIPLIAFILINSNINCFKSICYFIDNFQFSCQPNSFSSACSSTKLGEFAFFMTTFKAAIQLIETSF